MKNANLSCWNLIQYITLLIIFSALIFYPFNNLAGQADPCDAVRWMGNGSDAWDI
jgi:hypothetical protein